MLDIRTTGNAGQSNNRKYWTFEQDEMLDIRTTGNTGHSNNRKYWTF
ncbi:hypothetical protein TNIN_29791, partial [Trichonephila inaurata madagascariensis]